MDEDKRRSGRRRLQHRELSSPCQILSKFIAAYGANGVPINYVAVQNEPLYETGGYPTMFMNPLDEGRFISEYLGPELRNSHFQITTGTSAAKTRTPTTPRLEFWVMNTTGNNPRYPEFLLQNPEVRPYLAVSRFIAMQAT